MAKFRMKKGTIMYNGKMYGTGDIIEMDTFDYGLPYNFFEEVKPKRTKQKTKEEIDNGNNNNNSN